MKYLTKHNDIWNPLADFRREMNSLFDDFLISKSKNWRDTEYSWSPSCEVSEEDNHFLLSIEVPGISRDDMKIAVTENAITVSGARNTKLDKKENGILYGERQYGKFQRTFRLPPGIDADKIEANYHDGVLSLIVPKAESARARQIKIGTNNNGFFGKFLGDSRRKEENYSSETKEKIA